MTGNPLYKNVLEMQPVADRQLILKMGEPAGPIRVMLTFDEVFAAALAALGSNNEVAKKLVNEVMDGFRSPSKTELDR